MRQFKEHSVWDWTVWLDIISSGANEPPEKYRNIHFLYLQTNPHIRLLHPGLITCSEMQLNSFLVILCMVVNLIYTYNLETAPIQSNGLFGKVRRRFRYLSARAWKRVIKFISKHVELIFNLQRQMLLFQIILLMITGFKFRHSTHAGQIHSTKFRACISTGWTMFCWPHCSWLSTTLSVGCYDVIGKLEKSFLAPRISDREPQNSQQKLSIAYNDI